MLRKTFALVTAAMWLMGVAGAASAGDDDSKRQKGLVGTWEIVVSPDGVTNADGTPYRFTNILAVMRGGVAINTDFAVGAGPGHWERIGKRKYRVRVKHIVPVIEQIDFVSEDTRVYGGSGFVDVTVEITLSKDGKTAEGRYFTYFQGLNGNDYWAITGDVAYTRIAQRDDVVVQ